MTDSTTPFSLYCGIPDLNTPSPTPMTIYDIPCPNKRSHYTSDPLPASIYISSKKYVSNFTAPCGSPKIHFPSSDATETDLIMMKVKIRQ